MSTILTKITACKNVNGNPYNSLLTRLLYLYIMIMSKPNIVLSDFPFTLISGDRDGTISFQTDVSYFCQRDVNSYENVIMYNKKCLARHILFSVITLWYVNTFVTSLSRVRSYAFIRTCYVTDVLKFLNWSCQKHPPLTPASQNRLCVPTLVWSYQNT